MAKKDRPEVHKGYKYFIISDGKRTGPLKVCPTCQNNLTRKYSVCVRLKGNPEDDYEEVFSQLDTDGCLQETKKDDVAKRRVDIVQCRSCHAGLAYTPHIDEEIDGVVTMPPGYTYKSKTESEDEDEEPVTEAEAVPQTPVKKMEYRPAKRKKAQELPESDSIDLPI